MMGNTNGTLGRIAQGVVVVLLAGAIANGVLLHATVGAQDVTIRQHDRAIEALAGETRQTREAISAIREDIREIKTILKAQEGREK